MDASALIYLFNFFEWVIGHAHHPSNKILLKGVVGMVAISNAIRCQGFSFICLRAKGHSHVISDFQESLFGMDFEKNFFPHQVKTVSLSCCVLPK